VPAGCARTINARWGSGALASSLAGPPEPHYTPSRALTDFVRCRDLTYRIPGVSPAGDPVRP